MGYTRSRGRFFQLCISGRTRSVMLLMVSADMRLPNCSSRMSLISLVLLADGVQAYAFCPQVSPQGSSLAYAQPGDRKCCHGRAVCLWLFLPLMSVPACSYDRCSGCPSRVRLRQDELSISPSRALFSRFSNKGANTPSLPDSDTPAFSFSMACALISSKSNELLIN